MRRTLPLLPLLLVAILTVGISEPAPGQKAQPGRPGGQVVLPTDPGESVVDVSILAIQPAMLANVSDARLWAEFQRAAADAATRRVNPLRGYFGLHPGVVRNAPLVLTFNMRARGVSELLASPFNRGDANGVYSVVDLLVVLTAVRNDNGYRVRPAAPAALSPAPVPSPPSKVPPKAPPQGKAPVVEGCCGTLSVAHSLVRRMGKKISISTVTLPGPDLDGDGKPDPCWNPDFLRAIWAASGDADGGRGMTDSEIEQAHSYNPTGASPAKQTKDDGKIYDGSFNPCSNLLALAIEISKKLGADEDVTMRATGTLKDGSKLIHRVAVVAVNYNEGPPCSLDIRVLRTSKQDNGRGDFKNIPFNPGFANYRVFSDGSATAAYSNEFPGAKIDGLEYDAFSR